MTIAITASGISLGGPLVAGEKVAVTVSGLALAAEDKPTLALLARFPDALLASVELAEDAQTPGTWTGELDTATKQTALFFATARADERRDAALELVSGRVSLARLTVPMANSALCPKPDGSPFASPVYVPVPGPPGTGGDPYDQAPEMDGEASAGAADEYARGDHRHPTDTTRQAVIADLETIRSGAAAGATAVQPSALSAYRTAAAQDAIDAGKLNATGLTNNNGQLGALDFVTRYSFGFDGGKFITAPENSGAALTDNDIADSSSALGGALAAKANSSALAAVATTGDYADLNNKPTIPSAYGPFTAREEAVESQTREQTSYGKGGAATSDGNGNTWSSAFPKNTGTLALQEGIAPAFSTSSTYAVGDYVTHEGLLYKCTTAVSTAGAWNAANWTAVSAMGEMPAPGAPNHKIWAATAKHTISGSTSRYVVTPFGNDFALEEGCVVVFKSDAQNTGTTTELNVAGTGNKTLCRWTAQGWRSVPGGAVDSGAIVVAQYTLGSSYAGTNKWVLLGWEKAPLASPAFTGTPTAPTAAAGTNTTQVATTAFVQTEARYALTAKTPTGSGTSATVACEDRAINDFTVATGITSLTITPPAAVTGRARDFFLRLDCAGTALATISLPSGETVDFGADALAGLTGKAGVHLAMFTEIAANHWLISAKEAEA